LEYMMHNNFKGRRKALYILAFLMRCYYENSCCILHLLY